MTDHGCSQAVFCGCRIINSMHHKLRFLRNPRFPSPEKHIRGGLPDHSSAASAKSLGSSRSGSPSKASRMLTLSCASCADPIQSLSLFPLCRAGAFFEGKKQRTGYTFQPVYNMHVLCMSIINAVSEYKSSAHIVTMQSGCRHNVCQACVVCAKCLGLCIYQHRLDINFGLHTIKRHMCILFLLSCCIQKLLLVTSWEIFFDCHMSDATNM